MELGQRTVFSEAVWSFTGFYQGYARLAIGLECKDAYTCPEVHDRARKEMLMFHK